MIRVIRWFTEDGEKHLISNYYSSPVRVIKWRENWIGPPTDKLRRFWILPRKISSNRYHYHEGYYKEWSAPFGGTNSRGPR